MCDIQGENVTTKITNLAIEDIKRLNLPSHRGGKYQYRIYSQHD